MHIIKWDNLYSKLENIFKQNLFSLKRFKLQNPYSIKNDK